MISCILSGRNVEVSPPSGTQRLVCSQDTNIEGTGRSGLESLHYFFPEVFHLLGLLLDREHLNYSLTLKCDQLSHLKMIFVCSIF